MSGRLWNNAYWVWATRIGAMTAVVAAMTASRALAQFGPAPVAVAQVVEQKVSAGQTFVGTIMPVRHSVIGSAVAGRVIALHVNEGDKVTKDQPLAQIRTDALEIQHAAAKADYELRKQEQAELENGTRAEEVEQAKSLMLGAKAMMDFRQSRYKRIRELVEKRASSADELQDASSAAEMAMQQFQEAKATWDMRVAGPRPEVVLQAKARTASALEEVNRIEDQLRKHTLYAPFDGYVTEEHTEVGQWISQSAAVVEVVELSEVDVQVHVLENYVPHLQLGMSARVEVGALPGENLTGEIALVVPKADLKSRTFPVKVRLKNREVNDSPLLKAGMLARVTLPVGKSEVALLVPKDALVLGGPAPMVFAVDANPKNPQELVARPVPVQMGVVSDNLIEVKGDLKAGQRVITQGNERLRPGQVVTLVPHAVTAQK